MSRYKFGKEALRLHKEGHTYRKLAQHFEVAESTIGDWVRYTEEKYPELARPESQKTKGRLRKRTPELEDKIKELRAEGLTLEKISWEVGMSVYTVHMVLKETKAQTPHPNTTSPLTRRTHLLRQVVKLVKLEELHKDNPAFAYLVAEIEKELK